MSQTFQARLDFIPGHDSGIFFNDDRFSYSRAQDAGFDLQQAVDIVCETNLDLFLAARPSGYADVEGAQKDIFGHPSALTLKDPDGNFRLVIVDCVHGLDPTDRDHRIALEYRKVESRLKSLASLNLPAFSTKRRLISRLASVANMLFVLSFHSFIR